MDTTGMAGLRDQLQDRRGRLMGAIRTTVPDDSLRTLLHEVDAALEKFENGTYGLCETCHDAIEPDRLKVNPLLRNCLDHLTRAEQQVLEQDLDLAFQVQSNLLPLQGLNAAGWITAYHYEPAGPVSGDYCDLIIPETGEGELYFFLGDATGKGIAASLLMANLHAIFRSLTATRLPLVQLISQGNRLFCERMW